MTEGGVEEADVIVIGAGAAGLLAAATAAERGRRTVLLEKNPKPGVKILASGGTRCNVTNTASPRELVERFGKGGGPFLRAAFQAFDSDAVRALLADAGVETKVEDRGRVFPVSDRATDVADALVRRARGRGAELRLASPAGSVEREAGGAFLVAAPGRLFRAESVIVATGGVSYPKTGTTGDGYAIARAFGHAIVEPKPALVPFRASAPWIAEISGVAASDPELRLVAGEKTIYRERRAVLFTHFGLSGPGVLNASRYSARASGPLRVELDLAPDARAEDLDRAIREAAAASGTRAVRHVPLAPIPERLFAAVLAAGASVDPARRLASLTREERQRVVAALKGLPIPIEGPLGFDKAEVTAGGVDVGEVKQSTMESRLAPGLFFVGEVLDVEGPMGGYNFQAAFSTGFLAGMSA